MKNARNVAGEHTHFRLHDERLYKVAFKEYRRRTLSARIACEGRGGTYHYVPKTLTKAFREDAVVTCPHCCIIKDAWYEYAVKGTFTIRRVRELKRLIAK